MALDAARRILPFVAKALRIAGLSRRMPVARAASRVLRATFEDLLERIPAARSGDPEKGIHDLRVAVKRFREAFRLFRPALRKKTFRKHRVWIETLNDALGEVRERDVAMEILGDLTSGLREAPGSVSGFRARLESERMGAVDALGVLLEQIQAKELPAKLARAIEKSGAQAGKNPRTDVYARERVLERLREVRTRWTAARREATPESLHRVRIANKRLRYAIEPFHRMVGKEARKLYRSATRFHDALGDLHDADSMAVMLETAMAGAPKAERRTWERLAVKVIRARRVALRRVFALADALAPLWDEADRALTGTTA